MGMTPRDSLASLRSRLEERAASVLAPAVGVRENFREQLQQFFDLFEEALETGQTAPLMPLLRAWSADPTETDLQRDERALSTLIRQIALLTQETARELLPSEQAMELLSNVWPMYLDCLEQAAVYETESRTDYLTQELARLNRIVARVDKSKSDFVAVAAHEFKTPLALIEGYASMLDELLPPEMEQFHALLLGMRNGLKRLHDLVNDMLDVSLIDNNLLVLNKQPVWLHRIFRLLQAELQPVLEQRRQTLEIRSFPGAEELFFADPARLYQAFRNLLNNAIKFTPDGGKITVDGRLMSGFIEVTITDTGIGIPPEHQETIFEKFSQLVDVSLHSTGKTKFKGGGAGMGLPIARGIIEAHDGSLWAESPGYDETTCPGSTFHVLLPLRTQPDDPTLSKLFAGLASQNDSTISSGESSSFSKES